MTVFLPLVSVVNDFIFQAKRFLLAFGVVDIIENLLPKALLAVGN
jgi:hypothetical protein